MKTQIYKHLTVAISLLFTGFAFANKADAIKVGIVMPIEHEALNKISKAFQETVKKHPLGKNVHFKIANGQGDLQLENTQISQLFSQNYDYVIPISTGSTSRVLAKLMHHPNRSVLALASKDHKTPKKLNFARVEDEIPMESMFQYLKALIPELKSFAIVYSSSEKIFEEVSDLEQVTKKHGVHLQKLMVHSLHEIPELLPSLKKDNQLIFILKDNLIAHGISMLIPIGKKLGIPLVTSDEGTVREGADLGLGVSEHEIGIQGAKLFLKHLEEKKSFKDMKSIIMERPTLYLNINAKKAYPKLFKAAQKLQKEKMFTVEELGRS